MEETNDKEYQLDIEKELPDSPKMPKGPKILLLVTLCFSIILIVAVIILGVLYSKELSKTEDKSEPKPSDAPQTDPTDAPQPKPTDAPQPDPTDSPQPAPYPQMDTYAFFGNVYPNLTYDEGGKIINSFKKEGGENYNEAMGEINNGADYEKNDRNIYDLYIPQYALDRKTETNGIILWIHGGAWISGSKEQMDMFCKLYSQQGYISATVGYTLLAEPYKDFNIFRILDEITASIKAIKAELKNRGFSEEKLRLVIAGYSAGAHITLLYSYLIKQFNIIPIDFIINYVGPIGLSKKYFYKVKSNNETLDESEITQVPVIEQWMQEGKIIPIFDEKDAVSYMNLFYGNKFTQEELNEMVDEEGNIKQDNKNYQKMYNVVKYSFIPEIEDLHKDIKTICIYGGIDDMVGVTPYAYLKQKADADGRQLDFIYSRYEGHILIMPFTPDGIQKMREVGSLTMKYLKQYFGY